MDLRLVPKLAALQRHRPLELRFRLHLFVKRLDL